MDLHIHATAFSLGVKKSNIKLPWEREPVSPVFFKRPKLIPAPIYVPELRAVDETISLPRAEVEGRIHWSRKTSYIPWPVAQDRALAKVLEVWRLILMDNLEGSLVGKQIGRALRGEDGSPSVEQTIADALSGKSLSTLRSRSSSLMAFWRWKKSIDAGATILPITEAQTYAYVRELREHNAPKTKPARFVESVAFAHHLLGAEVEDAMHSPRVKGAVAIPLVIPCKKIPLTVQQIAFFENLAMDDPGQLGIFAGYCCMILHMSRIWISSRGVDSSNAGCTTIRQQAGRNTARGYSQLHAMCRGSRAQTGPRRGWSTEGSRAWRPSRALRLCQLHCPQEAGHFCHSKRHRQLPGCASC